NGAVSGRLGAHEIVVSGTLPGILRFAYEGAACGWSLVLQRSDFFCSPPSSGPLLETVASPRSARRTERGWYVQPCILALRVQPALLARRTGRHSSATR